MKRVWETWTMVRITKLLLFPIILFINPLLCQTSDLQFDHITAEDGLSNNNITCILQDNRGFMWFGTQDGLNRYDGYTFKIFKNDPADSTSLSNNIIRSIHEDSSGCIWVGTDEGLNRYNRNIEKFTRYLYDKNNSLSLSDNIIHVIYEDINCTIWVGTENGLNLFNRQKDTFTRYFFEGFIDSTRFYWNNNRITALAEDHNGLLLVGTMDDFFRFNPATGETSIIPDYSLYHPEGDWWPVMSTICKDRTGLYWIGLLLDGVATFDSRTGKSRLYACNPDKPYSFCSDASNWIYEDQTGLIWIASDEGLFIFDRKTKRFTAVKHNSSHEQSLSSNAISFVSGDKQGNIWIGTQNMGINKISKWKKPFKHYMHNTEDPASLATGEVNAICIDRAGNIWTGSYGGGLSCLNRATGLFTNYNIQLGLQFSDFKMVWGICEDRFGSIWSCYMGINRLDPVTGTIKYYWNEILNPESHAGTWTYTIFEDREGVLWFGTFGAGLERFNREKETFTHFIHDPNNSQSLSANDVYAIYQDTFGFIWVGTDNGLCKMIRSDKDNIYFIRYQHTPNNPNSLTGSIVYDIFEDGTHRFWIGTNGGLNQLDREEESFSVLTETDGLPCNDIYAILEDDHGFLWLRTKRGLVKFHPETQYIRTYDERDGLTFCKSIVDGYHAFYRGATGELYYGGANSFAVFHPDSLRDNPDPPIVVLTGFRIYNQPVEIRLHSLLQKSITETNEILLTHDQNMITFEFAAIDYTEPDKNQHAYQMEGVDKDWIYCGNQHTATYTNLDPGTYLFRVKGSNNDGVWNEEGISLAIMITPPWWRTNWAYAGYLLFIIGVIATTWWFQMKRIRVNNELKMKNFETQKLQEVDHLKSRFFANISHEFRTPLTLILGPINTLLEKFSDKDMRHELTIMQRNARRLQRLINQLLDLSKLEAGSMKLQAQPADMVALLNRIVQSFESQARLKNINLHFKSARKVIEIFVDLEKIEHIFYNLLSNALKFTPEGGEVTLSLNTVIPAKAGIQNVSWIPDQVRNDDVRHGVGELPFAHATPPISSSVRGGTNSGVKITVANTGSYIPADRIDKIFDRFYQVDDSYTREHEGTGIGLALTKELVELHQGRISVSCARLSEKDQTGQPPHSPFTKGEDAITTFTVVLLTGKEHLKPDEIIEKLETANRIPETDIPIPIESTEDIEVGLDRSSVSGFRPPFSKVRSPASDLPSPLLLIIEDNTDLCVYMRGNLQHAYRITEARDGAEGFKQALDKMPELIISDVMMPVMDGFQLCGKLKTDERTCHIPVILLTARAEAADKISGLETGADDYLTKPFDIKELQVRVKNLIDQRHMLREKFSRDILLKPKEIATSSYDQRFLQRVMEIIERHLENPNLKLATLTKEIGMSRRQLHRKLQALTNQSASRFIRSMRLKRAAELLQRRYGNVAEVSYKVGFNNPSYFAECFRKQFGQLPSEYSKD